MIRFAQQGDADYCAPCGYALASAVDFLGDAAHTAEVAALAPTVEALPQSVDPVVWLKLRSGATSRCPKICLSLHLQQFRVKALPETIRSEPRTHRPSQTSESVLGARL